MTPTFADLAKAAIHPADHLHQGRPAQADADLGRRVDARPAAGDHSGNSWKVKRIRNTPRVTLATCTMGGRPTSEAVEGTAAILDKSQTGAVYDAIGKRYGIVGKVFNFFSKLRGGMENNVGLELKVAQS